MVTEFSIFGQGKREPPAKPPTPVAVTWADLHAEELKRLLFAKYLKATDRLNERDDR